jgi:hypothetical protein
MQIRAKRGFGDRLGVVVIVLLALQEGLHVHRWDDARFVPQRPQASAHEMRAQTRLQANDAGRNLLEGLHKREPLDLAAKSDLTVRVEANDVKDVLPDIDAYS